MPDVPDAFALDPTSVSEEELDLAHSDITPAPFPDLDDVQDDEPEDIATLVAIVAASIPQRIANAKALSDNHTFVGVARCQSVVRGPILGLPARDATAAIAGHNSHPFHPIDDPASIKVPRGGIGFGFNGRAGHTWLELGAYKGSALVRTTDFHENGYVGVALRSNMLEWCSASSWGWGESDNGFDVWPDPAKPKPDPPEHQFHLWPWERKVRFLRNEANRERPDHPAIARHLDAWADRIAARNDPKKKKG